MRRILMLLTTMALALLMSAEVALAATYTIVSTSRNDYIFLVVSNRLSGDVININCREGYDTVRVTVDSGDTVNFDGCENTAISYRWAPKR